MICDLPPTVPCTLHLNHKIYQCAWGLKGVNLNKREGDNTTPIGKFKLGAIYYRADRINLSKINTDLPVHIITPLDGWCDDPKLSQYNQHITLPFVGSYERLWREDELYDLVIIIKYNDHPVIKHRGSAIFLHVAAPNFTPTHGCIALVKGDLIKLLPSLNSHTTIEIKPEGVFIAP